MLSLAKTIINKSTDELAQYLSTQPPVDEIDEYGYTPLIQTAIVNSCEKARLLLTAGADPNFTDLSGRTALHWAAENNNLKLCQLLLEFKANPNAYTRASQPVLVMPLLKNYDVIKKLLYQHGGDLNFAQDFVNAKLLGHAFSLLGRVDIVDADGTFTEVEFEGFYLEFTLALAHSSLADFKNNFAAKQWRDYFDKVDLILNAFKTAADLINYQHYLIDVNKEANQIDPLLGLSPLLIPIGQAGHALSLIKFGHWLIRCDRGEYGREHGSVIIYRIGTPERFTKEFIKSIMYKRQSREAMNEGLVEHLQLKAIMTLPLSLQLSGNCSWANVEAVVPALMFVLLLREAKSDSIVDIAECERIALAIFNDWLKWDQDRALFFCLQSMRGASPARAAAKAAILAAVLFQRLKYTATADIENAEKILRVLAQPEYEFILKGYVQTFAEERSSAELKSLADFLDQAGIDIDHLREADL